MNQFTFHQCPFANSPAPRPEQSPMQHLLPPQPTFVRGYKKQINHAASYSEGHSSREYADITLGNSPEFPSGYEPQRPIKSISYFNKKMGDSVKRNIHIGNQEAIVEVKVIPSEQKRIQPKQINSHVKNNTFYRSKEQLFPYAMTESKASKSKERQSRMSKTIVSPERLKEGFTYRHCYKCSPQRDPKDTCQSRYCPKCHPKTEEKEADSQCFKCQQKEESIIKSKFANKSTKQKQLSSEIKMLTEKMAEFKARMSQTQNTNRTLSVQLQGTKQKLKARETQITVLKSKNSDLSMMVVDLEDSKTAQGQMQTEIFQLKTMNQSLYLEIDELKKKIVYHQSKNSQSLRLLQKLNENISKRQQIMKKQLDEQAIITNKYLQDKNKLQIELSAALNKINELQNCHARHEKVIQDQNTQIYRLKETISNNKEGLLEKYIEQLKRQIEKNQAQIKQSQNKYHIVLNQLRSKQEEYSKLQVYTDQLRRQKSDSFLKIQQQKSKLFGEHDKSLTELKVIITEKEELLEKITYQLKQIEMKWSILNEQNSNIQDELTDLKQEKKILIRQKQELKIDCQHLLTKNQKLFKDIESAKQKQLQLNSIIANYQKDIIHIQETISLSINDLANRDLEIKTWKQMYEYQKSKNQQLNREIEEKLKIITTLEDNLKKEAKVVLLYKEGLAKLQDKKQVEWNNMNRVYIEQIKRLEETVKELMDYNQNKRLQKITVYKTIPYVNTSGESNFASHNRAMLDQEREKMSTSRRMQVITEIKETVQDN